jgi:hypothetical protein
MSSPFWELGLTLNDELKAHKVNISLFPKSELVSLEYYKEWESKQNHPDGPLTAQSGLPGITEDKSSMPPCHPKNIQPPYQ